MRVEAKCVIVSNYLVIPIDQVADLSLLRLEIVARQLKLDAR